MMLLFAKGCEIPRVILKIRALKLRVSQTNPVWAEIAKEYKRRWLGYLGEKSLEFYLETLSDPKCLIFHNLRLFDGTKFFQIDYLVLCPAFALVLEVKNLSGDIHFEKQFNQVTVTQNQSRYRIQNPVLQARLQASKLKKWIEKNHFSEIPILYLFVNANEHTHITSATDNEKINRNICNKEGLLEKIDQIIQHYKTERLDERELRKIKRLLLASDTPEDLDALKEYHLTEKDLLNGVQCPICYIIPMKYNYGEWFCPSCGCRSKTAFQQGIQDYFLLVKPSITNAEFRRFFQISSRKAAHNHLTSMNLPYTGTHKGRVYHESQKKNHLPMHKIIPSVEQ